MKLKMRWMHAGKPGALMITNGSPEVLREIVQVFRNHRELRATLDLDTAPEEFDAILAPGGPR